MKREAILHIPLSEYAHSINEKQVVFRLRAAKNDLVSCKFYYGDRACRVNPMIFTGAPMSVTADDLLFDYWEIELDTPYRRMCYYFELNDGNETILYYGDLFCDHVVEERSEFFQLPYLHRADIAKAPEWVKDAVVYNIFPDSFATGHEYISLMPTEMAYNGETIRGKLGGTIRGIAENIGYFKELGINCIYLNPFFAAGEYHKYDLLDYYTVDPCFGTNEDFANMMNVMHDAGIKVIIDGVFNHCGWRFFAFEDVVKNGESSKYKDWFYRLEFPVVRPDNWDDIPGYECFAYERLMPKLDTTNPEVKKYILDVCRHWIRTYDIDGWRLDCADEVDNGFWREFMKVAKEEKPDILLIGEVWANANHWLDGTMFHSTMNYSFRKHCREFFAKEIIDAEQFAARVTNMLMRYHSNLVPAQLNLLDSHDVSRFLSLCDGDKDRLKLAVLFKMCFIGIPCIFYGDEQGLSGVSEEEYRHPMIWDGDRDLFSFYKQAIALRNDNPALRRGTFKTLAAKGRSFVFRREYKGTAITIAINSSHRFEGEVLWQGNGFVVTKTQIATSKG